MKIKEGGNGTNRSTVDGRTTKDTYLSAYAHNRKLLVKEGDPVAKGQVIAEMGDSDADRVMLHFEIRRKGVAVDPLKYLPAR